MKTKLMTFAMMMAMLGISSCSKTDLYDEGKIAEREAAEAAAEQAKLLDAYKTNFIKTYGEINPNQSWDFSTNDMTLHFDPVSSQVRTRSITRGVNATTSICENYVSVLPSTLTVMNTNFTEGVNHETDGTYFGMNAPKNDFFIQPIFMGQSGGNFELHLKIDGTGQDILVWKKWQNIQYKKNNSGWQNLNSSHNEGGSNLVGVQAIQTKPIRISGVPENAKMYFYLKITSAASGYNQTGDQLGSPDGFIREYTFTADAELLSHLWGVDATKIDREPIQCKLIGCEDASTAKSDRDYNDVVFLLYGQPTVPQSFKVKNFYKDVKKRYMIEDLGRSDDTDFNDIVVDVIESYEAEVWYDENDNPLPGYDPENPTYTLLSTKAEIRALGGTLDFELKIGSTTWKKSEKVSDYTQMLNTDNPSNDLAPIATIEDIQGYNPTENNISVTVYQKDGEQNAITENFPEVGSVPLMIATNTETLWAKERTKFNFSQFLNPVTE